MNITRLNDTLTNEVINVIRSLENQYDTNYDVTVQYGHYSNTIIFNVCDKHGDNISIDVSIIDDDGNEKTYYNALSECIQIVYSIIQ